MISKKEAVSLGLSLSQSINIPKMQGRKKPYTAIGITRMKCARCSASAQYQWQVCADGNTWRPICRKCDIVLNRMVLRFFGFPDQKKMIKDYIKTEGE